MEDNRARNVVFIWLGWKYLFLIILEVLNRISSMNIRGNEIYSLDTRTMNQKTIKSSVTITETELKLKVILKILIISLN